MPPTPQLSWGASKNINNTMTPGALDLLALKEATQSHFSEVS